MNPKLRAWDVLASRMEKALKLKRVTQGRHVIEFVTGEAEEGDQCILVMTNDRIEFRTPTVDWSSQMPKSDSEFFSSLALLPGALRDVDEVRGEFQAFILLVQQSIQQLQNWRTSLIRKCHFCGQSFPPEDMHFLDGKNVCHGCAETHLGVVH